MLAYPSCKAGSGIWPQECDLEAYQRWALIFQAPSTAHLGLRHSLPWVDVLLPGVQAPEGPARALPRPLPMQGHDSEDGRLDVRDQRYTAVDRCPPKLEAVRQGLRVHRVRHIDDKVNLPGPEQGQRVGLTLHEGLVNSNDGVHVSLHLEHLRRVLCCVDLVAHVHKHPCILRKLDLLLRRTDAKEDCLCWQLEASSNHCLEKCIILIHAKACHLSRGLHLHAEPRVRVFEAAKGESGDL
mmetsp:Transcript_39019/g.93603  ORF Transcript_39019/g.93603 Transcript_39019/m.93603 type:complete len:240 (-) Transcript_39019:1699-2418(-)